MTRAPASHLEAARLGELALASPSASPALARDEAAHLARCARCRGELARRDPTAVFLLLAALPLTEERPPRLELPARRPAAGLRRARRVALTALSAAAALLAGIALLEPPDPAEAWLPAGGMSAGGRAGIVRRVHSDSATVVTLLPPGGDGPTVTLIIDDGVEL